MNGCRINETREQEAVPAHLHAGFFEVVGNFLGRADDAVPGAAAAGLQELAQRGPGRTRLGEMIQGALVAVRGELGERGVKVELFEVDHGEVGDGVQLAVDVALRELAALLPELVRFGAGAHHGGFEDKQHLDVVGVPPCRGCLGPDRITVGLHAVRTPGEGNRDIRVGAREGLAPR
ncbi:hypothetical protein D9M72_507410 [compost metagenome]